ncbi:DUF885 domain-containing protein [Angustibacter sp. Root456]|uniref:DUF885 domain-containing protein n=1 Tax=Angustibacter sp. Root456 TaxID=1736539 RepID=UPI0006FB25C2|nr:DUF885 domain-containing protein [Angustibacter sp. Root456]KQX69350.1 hypothetical protein ASD06_16560 [Angustibacter sp. Root456]
MSAGNTESTRFRRTATTALDVLLEADPPAATALGDHRFDDRLPDPSPAGTHATLGLLVDATGALDDLDDAELDAQDAVDLELLRSRLTAMQWSMGELAEQTWNPLTTVPAQAIYSLVARDTGEPEQRARALAARLSALPAYLAHARDQLGAMPRVHVETAAAQVRGAASLLGGTVDALLARAPGERAAVDTARATAAQALEQHARWLDGKLAESERDPRLGERDFAARLWYSLDTHTSPDTLLDRAESDLMAVEEEIAEVAALLAPRLGITAPASDRVREVLDALAAGAPVGDHDVLDRCRRHLAALTDLVRERDLVSIPDDAVEVIEMPEADRGVAVAYCDPPGALEPGGPGGPPPTFFAVAPTPSSWSAARVASFYREYNDHMLRDLTVHEAMPGHVLQLAHSRRFRGATSVRAALWSGTFVEGWAVYAEQLVADALEQLAPGDDATLALRMQQLKMRLRCTINAILDVRVHARGMTEGEAMALMTGRGHQEDGEATGKWRRALLTSGQLATYYVGHAEVSALATDLRAARPGATDRAVHDELLSHGSPSPRLLRDLLELV